MDEKKRTHCLRTIWLWTNLTLLLDNRSQVELAKKQKIVKGTHKSFNIIN